MQKRPASLFETAITPLLKRTGWRGATALCSLIFTSDFKKSSGSNLLMSGVSTLKSMRHIREIHDLTTAVNMIDDRMDTNPPEWILNAGLPCLGTTPSPIFLSDTTCPREFTHAFNTVVRAGLTRRDVGIAFNNILAYHSYERAQADYNFRQNPTLENRRAILDSNMRLAEAYTVFIFRCLTGAKTIPSNLDTFSYKDAVAHMPEVAYISYILQIFDDMRDVMVDLEAEILDGIPSSNWLAVKMSENNDFTTGGYKDEDVKRYVQERHLCTEGDSSPPNFIMRALERTAIEVTPMIKDVSTAASRAILSAMLDHLLHSAIKSSINEEMLNQQNKSQQEKEALALKYANTPNCHMT
jgi:hypothetical protein